MFFSDFKMENLFNNLPGFAATKIKTPATENGHFRIDIDNISTSGDAGLLSRYNWAPVIALVLDTVTTEYMDGASTNEARERIYANFIDYLSGFDGSGLVIFMVSEMKQVRSGRSS